MNLRCCIPFVFLLLSLPLTAQDAGDHPIAAGTERTADFEVRPTDGGMQFRPVLPLLQQRAGAPDAFWEHFWVFGEGTFSREARPVHHYPAGGEYEVIYLATGNYDTGKPPKKKKKKVSAYASIDGPAAYPDVLEAADRAVGIQSVRDASPEEENMIVISYHNTRQVNASGKLHLFFNERRFGHRHYSYEMSHRYYGEQEITDALSVALPAADPAEVLWASLQPHGADPFPGVPSGLAENRRDEALDAAAEQFLDHRVWSFDGLAPGERRNLFVALQATPEMVKDTTVSIFMHAAYESAGGEVFDLAVLEMPVVSSHDPNVQLVSDRKTGFRRIRQKTLKYKTRFQNTGEGPAGQIRIETRFQPEGVLDLEQLEILDLYPEVPLCPDSSTGPVSCLDTQFVDDKLLFTFHHVYLPGTRQEGMRDKDSTRGFVRYALMPTRKMKRRSFRSRAGIYFDNEPPVYTNWARTRFKWFEPSPMPMIGYNFVPDSSALNYPFFGIGVASAFKAYGFYLQPEIHTGASGRHESIRNLPVERRSGQQTIPGSNIVIRRDTVARTTVRQTVRRHTVELVPLHVRRNVVGLIGLGAGAAYILHFENREAHTTIDRQVFYQQCRRDAAGGIQCPVDPPILEDPLPDPETLESSRQVVYGDLRFFVDLNIGLARSGPVLGLRNYFRVGHEPGYGLTTYAAWRF
jgi:hypothetical protein